MFAEPALFLATAGAHTATAVMDFDGTNTPQPSRRSPPIPTLCTRKESAGESPCRASAESDNLAPAGVSLHGAAPR